MLTKTNKRFVIAFAAVSVILAAAAISFVYLHFDPSILTKEQERCYFSRELHLYCPGCGGTRAILALLDGHIVRSFLSNPVPVYAIVLLLRMWVALLHNTFLIKEESQVWRVLYNAEAWGILVVVVGTFVIRDLLLVFFHIDYLGDMT